MKYPSGFTIFNEIVAILGLFQVLIGILCMVVSPDQINSINHVNELLELFPLMHLLLETKPIELGISFVVVGILFILFSDSNFKTNQSNKIIKLVYEKLNS